VRSQIIIDTLLIASVTIDVCGTLGRDRAELHRNPVVCLVGMRKRMGVSTNAANLCSAATKIPALEAEPQVLLEIAFGAMTQVLRPYLARLPLIQGQYVFTAGQLLLPGLDFLFAGERIRRHDAFNDSRKFRVRPVEIVSITFKTLDGQRGIVAVSFSFGSYGKLGYLRRWLVSDDSLTGSSNIEDEGVAPENVVNLRMVPVTGTSAIKALQTYVQTGWVVLGRTAR